MTVFDLSTKIPPDEFIEWLAYFEIKNDRIKKEADKHKAENKPVVSKRYG